MYFGARGSQDFLGYGWSTCRSTTTCRSSRSVRPWLKVDVFNLFDNLKQITWNTTVRQNRGEYEGQPRTGHWLHPGPELRQGGGEQRLPAPLAGVVGGRTFRVAFGVRF